MGAFIYLFIHLIIYLFNYHLKPTPFFSHHARSSGASASAAASRAHRSVIISDQRRKREKMEAQRRRGGERDLQPVRPAQQTEHPRTPRHRSMKCGRKASISSSLQLFITLYSQHEDGAAAQPPPPPPHTHAHTHTHTALMWLFAGFMGPVQRRRGGEEAEEEEGEEEEGTWRPTWMK